jgi:hypothetical protein
MRPVRQVRHVGVGRVDLALRTKASEVSDRLTRDLGEFALVPRWLAANATGNTLRLWCVLWVYSGNGTHAAWPAQETLAAELGLSDRTVRRCLKELEDLGALTSEMRLGTSNLYTLQWGFGNRRPVDNAAKPDIVVRLTPDNDVLPPLTPVSYKERLSEIENQREPKSERKLSRDEVRDIVTKSAFCPTCREKVGRCLCDWNGSEADSGGVS